VKVEWLFEMASDYFNPRGIKHLETRRELERAERQIIE
jgi:pre-mRNA-splicing factor ATP-dependent RNA helicase DHX15/PRP43